MSTFEFSLRMVAKVNKEDTDEEKVILVDRLRTVSSILDDLVSACTDENGRPQAPGLQALMQARSILQSGLVKPTYLRGENDFDVLVLEFALFMALRDLDSLVVACLDADGKPQAPTKQVLMQARKNLPRYCKNTLKADRKETNEQVLIPS